MSINLLFSRCEIFILSLYMIKNNLNRGKICTVRSPSVLPQKLPYPTSIQIHRHLQLTRDVSTSDLQGNHDQRSTLLSMLSLERKKRSFVCEKKMDCASDFYILVTKTHDTPLPMKLFAKCLSVSTRPNFPLVCLFP